MNDKDKKQNDEVPTDKPMKANERIWGDELKPGTIEIEQAEIEDDIDEEK